MLSSMHLHIKTYIDKIEGNLDLILFHKYSSFNNNARINANLYRVQRGSFLLLCAVKSLADLVQWPYEQRLKIFPRAVSKSFKFLISKSSK